MLTIQAPDLFPITPLDFNNVKTRLERLYASVGARFESDLSKCINITHERDESGGVVTLTFDKNENDTMNKILTILHNLANFKDHLKKAVAARGHQEQEIEDEINATQSLQLVLDLSNAEKHGYPLTRTRRSGLDPKIGNVRHSLLMQGSSETAPTKVSFTVNPFTGEYASEGNCKVMIDADILTLSGEKIANLDSIVNNATTKWEAIIDRYGIN